MGILFIISFQLIFVAIGVFMCITQDDCPEGHACIYDTCARCLRCSLLFRKGNSCVVDFKECGDCLEGYEEISVTDFSSVIKPCKPIKKKVKFIECTDNNTCPPNNYCSEHSCIKCFNCSIVNRLPPTDKCAKGLNECGSCMDGFSEVAMTTGTNSMRCETSGFVTHKTDFLSDISTATYTSISVLFVASTVFFTTIFLMWMKKSRSLPKTLCISYRPTSSAPPLGVMEQGERCGGQSLAAKCISENSRAVLLENERRQQANVFKEPDAPYYRMPDQDGYGEPPRGNEVAGGELPMGNESSTPPALRGDRALQQPPRFSGIPFAQRSHELQGQDVFFFSGVAFPQRLHGLRGQDVEDTSVPDGIEIRVDGNASDGVDSVALDIENGGQVVEPPHEETTDPVPVQQSLEP